MCPKMQIDISEGIKNIKTWSWNAKYKVKIKQHQYHCRTTYVKWKIIYTICLVLKFIASVHMSLAR